MRSPAYYFGLQWAPRRPHRDLSASFWYSQQITDGHITLAELKNDNASTESVLPTQVRLFIYVSRSHTNSIRKLSTKKTDDLSTSGSDATFAKSASTEPQAPLMAELSAVSGSSTSSEWWSALTRPLPPKLLKVSLSVGTFETFSNVFD